MIFSSMQATFASKRLFFPAKMKKSEANNEKENETRQKNKEKNQFL